MLLPRPRVAALLQPLRAPSRGHGRPLRSADVDAVSPIQSSDSRPLPAPSGPGDEQASLLALSDARLLEGVASTTPDFVYLFDLDGRFVYANARLLEVWGVTLDKAVGRTPRELGYEQWHHDMHMREIAEVIETQRPIKGEVPFRAPLTGIFGIYEYIFTPVIGPDGAVELIGGTTRDVTERKRIEEALQQRESVRERLFAAPVPVS